MLVASLSHAHTPSTLFCTRCFFPFFHALVTPSPSPLRLWFQNKAAAADLSTCCPSTQLLRAAPSPSPLLSGPCLSMQDARALLWRRWWRTCPLSARVAVTGPTSPTSLLLWWPASYVLWDWSDGIRWRAARFRWWGLDLVQHGGARGRYISLHLPPSPLSLSLFISLTLSSPPLQIHGRRGSGVGRSREYRNRCMEGSGWHAGGSWWWWLKKLEQGP